MITPEELRVTLATPLTDQQEECMDAALIVHWAAHSGSSRVPAEVIAALPGQPSVERIIRCYRNHWRVTRGCEPNGDDWVLVFTDPAMPEDE